MRGLMNRRSVLGAGTTSVIGLASATERGLAQPAAAVSAMSQLSAYMSAAGNTALPAEVAEHAKHHLLDSLASMISGSQLPPGQAAQRYIGSHGGKGSSTIAGAGLT